MCKENPLAPVIGRLGLPLYRTSGDNSVLYDHDLERYVCHNFLIQGCPKLSFESSHYASFSTRSAISDLL